MVNIATGFFPDENGSGDGVKVELVDAEKPANDVTVFVEVSDEGEGTDPADK